MRIGLLASVGGTIDAFFPEIAEYWESQGHTIYTAASTVSRVGSFTCIRGLTRNPRLSNVSVPQALSRWITDSDIEVVITNTATASALARIRTLPAPVIYFCHGLHWNSGEAPGERIWRLIEGFLARRTSAVITLNSDDEDWFNTRIKSENILRLDEGVGVPLGRYKWSSLAEAEPRSLLWAGEFSNRKRPWLAVEIIHELTKVYPDVRLTMIGDGPLRQETIRQISDLNLNTNIVLPGKKPFSDVLPKHSALLHTAEWEGLPRVGLEAAAMGRRTFAFDVKGVRDLPHAKLVHDGGVDEMVSSLSKALNSPETECQMDEGFRERIDATGAAKKIEEFARYVARSKS